MGGSAQELAGAETELTRRERPPRRAHQKSGPQSWPWATTWAVWEAPTTTDRDRKALLHSLVQEVNITVHREEGTGSADLVLRWKGGAITELSVPIKPKRRLRTDEGTVELVRRLAAHYPDANIAGILNRQRRSTARGLSFTAGRVQSLRYHWGIPCHEPVEGAEEGELLTVADAAKELGLAPSTLHRWLSDGFIAGEQLTPAAPWRIRLTPDVRSLFVDTLQRAGWQCSRRRLLTASPARPSCNV